jgi:hypothetical protein
MNKFRDWLYNWRTSAGAAVASFLIFSLHLEHDDTLWCIAWGPVCVFHAILAVIGYRTEPA